MKKFYVIFIFFVLINNLYSQSISTPVATQDINTWYQIGSNFTAADINGTRHDLQEYLDSGKPVVVYFFAAWCPTSWIFHMAKVCEKLDNAYGASGSNEIVILLVEQESTNTINQLKGITAGNDNSGRSSGDFTNGGTFPLPIIDDHRPLDVFREGSANLIPSAYLVCPSGYYKRILEDMATDPSGAYPYIQQCFQGNSVYDSYVNNITVFPNPAAGFINIQHAQGAEIRLINMTGQCLLTLNNEAENCTVDLSGFPAGSYIMEITYESSSRKVKLVKN